MPLLPSTRFAVTLSLITAVASSLGRPESNRQQTVNPHILRRIDGEKNHLDVQVERILLQELDILPKKDRRALSYSYNYVKLDEDGTPELLVHLLGADVCGSSGCTTFVFRQQGREYHLISKIGMTRTPILVSETKSHGWRDLLVWVVGGGIQPGYYAVLSFDGQRYPENPTVSPARSLHWKLSCVAYLAGRNWLPIPAP